MCVYEAFSPDDDPSFATVAKVAGALGLRVSFKPAKRTAKAKRTASANLRRAAKATKDGKRGGQGQPCQGDRSDQGGERPQCRPRLANARRDCKTREPAVRVESDWIQTGVPS